MKAYNMSSARVPEQIKKMQRLQDSNICAFCPEYFDNYHDHPVEFQTKHWLVTKNDYPYEHTSLHLLVIPTEHVSLLGELSAEAQKDFLDIVVDAERHFALTSYGLAMRVGDMHYNGGSVKHLHAHIIVGDFSEPDNHHHVRFKLSSVPK